jgi:hypothetical protein
VSFPVVPQDPVVSVLLLVILLSVGLNVAFVRAILKGDLVPGRVSDTWRAAFFTQQEINQELASTGRATRAVLRALPDPAPDEVVT